MWNLETTTWNSESKSVLVRPTWGQTDTLCCHVAVHVMAESF